MSKKIKGSYLLNAVGVALVFALLTGLFAANAFGTSTTYIQGICTTACYTIIMVTSLNLVVGFMGEFSLGHAGFVSVGAYVSAIVSGALAGKGLSDLGLFLIALLVGGLVAGIMGVLVGIPALRLKGDYLAIVTLACGEIIKNIITNLDFTGGALGLNTNPIYSNAKKLLPYAVILVLLTVLVMMNLKRSKQGRAIMAIRDNRIAAESVGIDVTRYKLMVFMLAAFFAGAAGVLYGHFFANVKAATFDYNMSIEILVIVVLGGMGSIPGSIIAAIVLTALPEAMREFADYRMLLYAIVLIIVMLATNNPTMKEFFHRISPAELLRRAKKKKAKSLQKEGA